MIRGLLIGTIWSAGLIVQDAAAQTLWELFWEDTHLRACDTEGPEHQYAFSGKLILMPMQPQYADFAHEGWMTVATTWRKSSQEAVERIEIEGGIEGHVTAKIKCNNDPWLHPETTCSAIDVKASQRVPLALSWQQVYAKRSRPLTSGQVGIHPVAEPEPGKLYHVSSIICNQDGPPPPPPPPQPKEVRRELLLTDISSVRPPKGTIKPERAPLIRGRGILRGSNTIDRDRASLPIERPEPSGGFEERRREALAARVPGGPIGPEPSALLRELEDKYASQLEIENARLPGFRPESVSPAGVPDTPVSADPDDMDFERHPCGRPEAPLEVTGIQATPPLDPGELVLVQGCGLGTDPGKLRLVGDFPGGYLDLEIEHWYFTQVRGRVPPVTGVGDMPEARVQLVRQDNQLSQLLDVGGFRATREVKRLDHSVVTIICGSGFGNQQCMYAVNPPSQFFEGGTFAAMHGHHVTAECESAVQRLGTPREGADVASVSLANGWELAGLAWWWDYSGEGYVLQPTGFNVNASSASLTMQWGTSVSQCSGPQDSKVWYRVDLYGVGPKGVPYK